MKRMSKMKRALFTLALMIPAGNFAWGQWQVVASESFEQSCSNSSNAFYTNCIPNWTSASGTPDNSSLLGAAYDGNKYAHLYANYNGSCAQGEGSEGILLNYNFQAGVTYRITYAMKGAKGINPASQAYFSHWLLTNGMPNQTGVTCSAGDLTPMVPSGSQTINTPSFNPTSWTLNQQTFVPNVNSSQLWFRHFVTSTVQNSTASATILIDKVVIEKLCTLTPTISAASSFCDGSPITFVGGYTSSGCSVDNHVWTVVETDQYGIVAPGATEWWSSWYSGAPGWFTIPSQGSGGPVMTCGKYYRVKLAVQNSVVTWAEATQVIYVNCPPVFAIDQTAMTICNGESAGISVRMGRGSNSVYTLQIIPVSPSGPAVYTGPLAGVQVSPSGTTVYSVSVTDNVTGCTTTQYVTVTVINNDPSFSLTVNTTNPSYFTLSLDANYDFSYSTTTGFYYSLIIEELDGSLNPYYQDGGTNCWWNYPGNETFMGYVSNGTGTFSQTPWGSCPQPAGQFLYNHMYRITRVTWNDNCPQEQFSMIVMPVKSGNGQNVVVFEDTEAPDLTGSSLGTSQIRLDSKVEISPNPGTGIYTISLPDNAVNVTVFNLLGEEIHQFEPKGSSETFDLSRFPKGVYMVKVQSETEQTTKKIILE